MKTRKKILIVCLTSIMLGFQLTMMFAQETEKNSPPLSVKYEELTVPDFIKALDLSGKTCIIPLGILEKHGNQLPIGTDLLNIRNVAVKAAQREYVVVFPDYYFGQINEARHQPGVIAYSPELIWKLLEETCEELGRNGFTKIILVNGHGGNIWLNYFCMSQLHSPKNYVVYLYSPAQDNSQQNEEIKKLSKSENPNGHAGENETSAMLANRPELVHLDAVNEEAGKDLQRLNSLTDTYTAIWWYARFPNHYNSGAGVASAELGKLLVESDVEQLVKMIKVVKEDTKTLQLQNEFYKQSTEPLKTPQNIGN
jgi:creatinine amidohydrolase